MTTHGTTHAPLRAFTRTSARMLTLAFAAGLATAGCQRDAAPDVDSASTATPSVAAAPPVPDTGWVASSHGLGVIRTGLRRADLLPVLGQPSRAGYYTHASCSYVGGTALPAGVRVMLSDSTVARVDVTKPGVRTREGAQVGDTEASVLKLYDGRVAVTPHKYSGPTGHYLTVTPPGDSLHRIVFETDGATVQNYRVGRLPEVEWVEGCS